MSLLHSFDVTFADAFRPRESWAPWRAFLCALEAAPMTAAEFELFKACTGRTSPPAAPFKEAHGVIGRRGGKSAVAALLAIDACCADWAPFLRPGELARAIIVSPTKDQSETVLRYCRGLIDMVPALRRRVVSDESMRIEFADQTAIEVFSSNWRTIRSRSASLVIMDELAFLRDESGALSDKELVRAVMPMLGTLPGARVIGLSSPYAKAGVLYERHRDHFGRDDSRVLVWQASTEVQNPSYDRDFVAQAYADDPEAASAEHGAQFRSGLSQLFDIELVQSLVRSSPLEIERRDGFKYHCYLDPSGGRSDRFGAAVSHAEKDDRIVLDAVRTWPAPFEPAAVVAEAAAFIKSYGLRAATGDAYAGAWVPDAFKAHGIEYRASPLNKSGIYLESVPIFAQGRAELPNLTLLIRELVALERRTARGGRDSIDHPPRFHDDAANCACGALHLADKAARRPEIDHGKIQIFTLDNPGSVMTFDRDSVGARDRSPYPDMPWIK